MYIADFWVVAQCRLVLGGTRVLESHTASTIRVLILNMEAVCASEAFIPTYQTIRCHNPEDRVVNLHHRENPISYNVKFFSHSLV
jgi:hypothetical protein